MEEIINGKAIYSPKGAALEYGRVGCNFYTGCYHDCGYCYLKRGVISKQLGGIEVKLKKCFKDEEDAIRIFYTEVLKHIDYLRQVGIFFSFTTDPMIPETINLTMYALGICIDEGIPIKILTKNADWVENPNIRKLLNEIKDTNADIRFGFTLTGRDDMESNAPSNMARIESMRILKEKGIKTFASIEPVIDWKSSLNIVKAAILYCDHFKIGLRSGVKEDYYDNSETINSVTLLKHIILRAGKTVYFKESIRKRIAKVIDNDWLMTFLKDTLDMDGNII